MSVDFSKAFLLSQLKLHKVSLSLKPTKLKFILGNRVMGRGK
jgi:hypothetical protein